MSVITVEIYQTEDGHQFSTRYVAENYEEILRQLKKVDAILPHAIDDGDAAWINGRGFIQHSQEAVAKYTNALGKVLLSAFGSESTFYTSFIEDPKGVVGRYFIQGGIHDDGVNCSEFYDRWARLLRIDDQFREWGNKAWVDYPNRRIQKPWPKVSQ